MKFITTLNKIREHSPCEPGWGKLLKNLGKTKADDEPLDIIDILNSNGVEDAAWCLRCFTDEASQSIIRYYAAWCAAQVLHIFEEQYPDDKRPRQAVEAAYAYARGEITQKQLRTARDAAEKAARAAVRAARDAAWAALAAGNVMAARGAARAARAAVWAALAAVAAETRAAQEKKFREVFGGNFIIPRGE